jgi:hypothetical protein
MEPAPISIENTNESQETESKLPFSKSSREIQDRNKNTRNWILQNQSLT